MKTKPAVYTALYDENWRNLTLRKPAVEWLNAGAPDISGEDGFCILNEEGEYTGENTNEFILVYDFLKMTIEAYHNKYGDALIDGEKSVDEFWNTFLEVNSAWLARMEKKLTKTT